MNKTLNKDAQEIEKLNSSKFFRTLKVLYFLCLGLGIYIISENTGSDYLESIVYLVLTFEIIKRIFYYVVLGKIIPSFGIDGLTILFLGLLVLYIGNTFSDGTSNAIIDALGVGIGLLGDLMIFYSIYLGGKFVWQRIVNSNKNNLA